jgi:hypothetical protein
MSQLQSSSNLKINEKRRFTKEEDKKLIEIINSVGKNWELISKIMCTGNARQCKERWENYLNPKINKLYWTIEEDEKLIELRNEIGLNWISISHEFDGKSAVALKTDGNILRK